MKYQSLIWSFPSSPSSKSTTWFSFAGPISSTILMSSWLKDWRLCGRTKANFRYQIKLTSNLKRTRRFLFLKRKQIPSSSLIYCTLLDTWQFSVKSAALCLQSPLKLTFTIHFWARFIFPKAYKTTWATSKLNFTTSRMYWTTFCIKTQSASFCLMSWSRELNMRKKFVCLWLWSINFQTSVAKPLYS